MHGTSMFGRTVRPAHFPSPSPQGKSGCLSVAQRALAAFFLVIATTEI